MAESKRTFQGAKMNKDIEEKILKPGEYRDALNISVDFSEDGNIGSIENLKGNALISGQNIISDKITNPKVIGSYPNPEENKIYYFVTGTNADGIFEYDATVTPPVVSTVIIDSSTAAPTPEQQFFKFQDAGAQAAVAKNGNITVTSNRGQIESLTENFGETVATDTPRKITVRVKVPSDFSNTGDYVNGQLTATQPALTAPAIIQNEPTGVTQTGFTLNGEFTNESGGLTEIGFYWRVNTGGSTTTSVYSNKFVAQKNDLVGNAFFIGKYPAKHGYWDDPFEGVAASDIIVLDASGTTVSSSTYTIAEASSSPQPHSISFSTLPTFPVTVAQISSATTLTDAFTPAQVQSGGTQIAITGSNISSPFSSSVTGQTAGTQIASVAYATNSSGTTLSEVKYFTLTASTINRWSGNEYVVVPVIDDDNADPTVDEVDDRNVGYGSYFKDSGYAFLSITAPSSDGIEANKTDVDNLHSSSGGVGGIVNASFTSNPSGIQFRRGSGPDFGRATIHLDNMAANTSYQITIPSEASIPSKTIRINNGSPSGTYYTSTLSLNLSGVFVAKADIASAYDYNVSPAPLASYILGPVAAGEKAQCIIPLNNVNTAFTSDSTQSFVSSFNANNLTVTVTGKTEGTDFDYYIEDTSMAIFGNVPGIIFEGIPENLGATPTVNITYTT